MDAATQQMDNLGGWDFQDQAEAMLAQVGRTVLADINSVGYWSTALNAIHLMCVIYQTALKD